MWDARISFKYFLKHQPDDMNFFQNKSRQRRQLIMEIGGKRYFWDQMHHGVIQDFVIVITGGALLPSPHGY